MESRYDSAAAARFVADLAGRAPELVALRTYTARLVGSEPNLVLHGGGNTSVKATATTLLGETIDVLHIKGSGWDLASIDPEGHPAVRLAPLRELRRLDAMTDEAMVNALRTNLLDASAPNPSVEALLHALLPARFVDHTHADAILALCDQPDGKAICTSVFGRGLVWIPYVMPGFALAKRCAELFEAVAERETPAVMVLERHGLFTWGETARESYERTIEAVTRAERYALERRRSVAMPGEASGDAGGDRGGKADAKIDTRWTADAKIDARWTADAKMDARWTADAKMDARWTAALPVLRGVFAKLAGDPSERGPIVRTRTTESILALMARPNAAELVAMGCMTPDHVLRTKPTALFVAEPAVGEAAGSGFGARPESAGDGRVGGARAPAGDGRLAGAPESAGRLAAQLEAAVTEYARRYDAYFEQMCRAKGVRKKKLDPWPRVVLLGGLGACAIADSAREADIALDIYEHTAAVMLAASDIGAYAPCSRADLFDVEYWSLEQAKIKPVAPAPLARCIALVTGAAHGIGRATAERLLGAGAHVAAVDRDGEALAAFERSVAKARADRIVSIVADVRDPGAIDEAFARTVRRWGGVDVVVSNAGTAPQGRLETETGIAAMRESLDLNCLSHAQVARAAVRVMTAQGRGGSLAFNASKAAFNPGPGFGPYAVAKTALVALMRQYAVDLGGQGIRSNAVNADRVRTHLFDGGVLEARAAARGLSVDDYFRSNLLALEVRPDDVADAFLYLACARATTGAVIPVDGGNAAAFPR